MPEPQPARVPVLGGASERGLEVPRGHLRQSFQLPDLQPLISGAELREAGAVGSRQGEEGTPSPRPSHPLLLRSRSHVVLSPLAGAQVLGAGAEGPRDLAQVLPGELGTGRGG